MASRNGRQVSNSRQEAAAAAVALNKRYHCHHCGRTVTIRSSARLICPNCSGAVVEALVTPLPSPFSINYPDFFMRTSDYDSDNDLPGLLLPPPPPPPFFRDSLINTRPSDIYNNYFSIVVEEKNEDEAEDEEELLPSIKITEELMASYSSQCAVCLNSFELDEVVKKMPCKHLYHSACILPWLESHGSCPVCRSLLYRT